ncbi:MAG: hypothetical protein FWF15_05710 [Oscillospiraceae bacterium]|nr:hypothetical protein [Oscillospiraceae bacterium]
MKKLLILLLFVLLFASCKNSMDESLAMTITIVIPDMNGAELKLTEVYPTYMRGNCAPDNPQEGYDLYFKEGGTVTFEDSFSVEKAQQIINDEWVESEIFHFLQGEVFVLQADMYYYAWGYSDGHISAEYDDENPPVARFAFFGIAEEKYKRWTLIENPTGGTYYPLSKLEK